MAGIKSTTDSSVQVHEPVDAQVGAAPPSKKEQAPSKSRAADGVEQFSGQAPASRTGSGPARQTDQAAAAGGAQLAESMKTIRESLDGSFLHWIGDQDLAQAHHALEALGPVDYRAAMASMDKEGLLATYLGKLEPEARNAFLAQAARKGFVEIEEAVKARGQFAPPDRPETFRNDPKLPSAVRDAVYADARDAARTYMHEYGEYLERFQDAVNQTKSGADLRALGEIAKLDMPGDGMCGHPDAHKNSGQWLSLWEYRSSVRLEAVVRQKLDDFRGEKHVGTLTAEGSLGVKAPHAGFKVGGEVSTQGTAKGKYETSVSAGLGIASTTLSFENQNKKKVTNEAGLKTPFAEVAASADSDGKHKLKAQVLGTGVEMDSNGMAKATVGIKDLGEAHAYASPKKGDFGAGFTFKPEVLGYGVAISLGVSGHTASQGTLDHALVRGNPGVRGTPAELVQGTAWNDLSERARQMHRHNGWTEAEWTSKLPRR
ncbi:MAG: hypothetical protein ACYC8T_06770 [Myxococcaceae bacterium]